MPPSAKYTIHLEKKDLEIRIEDQRIFVDNKLVDPSLQSIYHHVYSFLLDNKHYDVVIAEHQGKDYTVEIESNTYTVRINDHRDLLLQHYGVAQIDQTTNEPIRAPMPGLVLDVLVSEGDRVASGQGLLILEAMKMENEIKATSDGVIGRIYVNIGDAIGKNDVMIEWST